MKIALPIFLTIFILTVFPISAESIDEPNSDKPFVTFNYGATASWLTRIIKQTGRSNFVFRDFLPGLYFNTEMQNLSNFSPAVRIAAYYPLISTFNYMPNLSKTPLHFAADLFTGIKFKKEWDLVTLNAGPGLHLFFMTADRWNYLNLGVAAAVGLEFAVSSGWTLFIDGFASYDYGNLGTNRQMEPFDVAFQYQTAIGVRYSKKKRNTMALFMPKQEDQSVILDR